MSIQNYWMTRLIVIIRNINAFQHYRSLTVYLVDWLLGLIACFSKIKYFSSYGLRVNPFLRNFNSLLTVGGGGVSYNHGIWSNIFIKNPNRVQLHGQLRFCVSVSYHWTPGFSSSVSPIIFSRSLWVKLSQYLNLSALYIFITMINILILCNICLFVWGNKTVVIFFLKVTFIFSCSSPNWKR